MVSSDQYHFNTTGDAPCLCLFADSLQAHPLIDYVLQDWMTAGFTQALVCQAESRCHRASPGGASGRRPISARDMREVDRRLRQALALIDTTLADVLAQSST